MGLFYSDREPIKKIEEKTQLKEPSKEINDKRKLSESMVTDDLYFDELYNLWICMCVEYVLRERKDSQKAGELMGELFCSDENLKEVELIRKLFRSDEQETEEKKEKCRKFMEYYCEMMITPVANPFCPKDICTNIRKVIEDNMRGIPEYIKLRVLVVCVFLGRVPEEIFESGKEWYKVIFGEINHDEDEKNYCDIEKGMKFYLNLKGEGKLFPRILRNNNEEVCEFKVIYLKDTYTIKMPPYGILRAVFADENCKTLVSIKGNITFDDVGKALVQRGEKDNCILERYSLQDGSMEISNKGFLLDASTNGRGGITLLSPQGISSTMYIKVPEELPIRCYGSGEAWAWLNADGNLNGNLGDGKMLKDVTAVVEDGDKGLLVCCKGKCWDYRKIPKVEISEMEMVQVMLKRFITKEGECESVRTRYLQLSITRNGERKEKKL